MKSRAKIYGNLTLVSLKYLREVPWDLLCVVRFVLNDYELGLFPGKRLDHGFFPGNFPTFSEELFPRTESPLLNKDHAEVEICWKIVLLFWGASKDFPKAVNLSKFYANVS